jgi:UPF0042 nucleotide-binding protein
MGDPGPPLRPPPNRIRHVTAPAEAAPLVVVTGLSGSGKTQAVRALESLGYRCTDNLPAALLPAFLQDAAAREAPAAVVLDGRDLAPGDIPSVLGVLRSLPAGARVIFLDAEDSTLARRYSEARKQHPLDSGEGLAPAIATERRLLGELRELADVIDTSRLRVDELVRRVQEKARPGSWPIRVDVMSFGFKHGIPADADWVLDARFLENPFYITELRPLSGKDLPIREHVLGSPLTAPFLDRSVSLIGGLLDAYREQGKPSLTVAVGCTGGRHRSVVLADELASRLEGVDAPARHRDLEKGGSRGK